MQILLFYSFDDIIVKMNIKANIDISKNSFSTNFTPSSAVRKLPLFLLGSGYFYANQDYYTRREGYHNYLLIFTLSGGGELSYDGKFFSIGQGDVMLIDCSKNQFYSTKKGSGHWEFYYIHLNGSAMDGFYELLTENKTYVFSLDKADGIGEIMKETVSVKKSDTLEKSVSVSDVLYSLMSLLLKSRSGAESFSNVKKSEIIENSIELIHENFQDNINLEQMAQSAHLSKFYFLKLFKSYAGVTPYEYLINCRVNFAKKLLHTSSLTVKEICYESGFSDENNFIRCFKKTTGNTPLHYRQLNL